MQAAGEVEKGDGQEEEPYGPGPSLRPQSMAIHIILCLLLLFVCLQFKNHNVLELNFSQSVFVYILSCKMLAVGVKEVAGI